MSEFREFVAENLPWFAGRLPETAESLAQAERDLGVRLPEDLRWLLITHGYSYATGIDSLEGSVSDTKMGRLKLGLPGRFVILKNHGLETDAVLFDTMSDPVTGNNPVHLVAWEALGETISLDTIAFPSYLDYVRNEVEIEKRHLSEEDILFGPSEYPISNPSL